jgi:hypothetical protein
MAGTSPAFSRLSVGTAQFIGSPHRLKEILVARCIDLKRNPYHQGAGVPNLGKMLMDT